MGTAVTEKQIKLIARYTKEVILTMDADAAGQKAIKRAGEILQNTGLNVRVLVIPDGKDPDDYIKKHGTARFKALIEGATSEIEYKLLMAVDGIDTGSNEGILQDLSRAAAIIAQSSDVMTRDLYIGRLSEKYGVSRAALQTKVDDIRRNNYKQRKKKEFDEIVRPKFDKGVVNSEKRLYPAAVTAEETVIAILLQHPDFYESAYERLKPEDMISVVNRRIYKSLCECCESGRQPDISYFGEILSPEEMGYLTMLANSEKGDKNALIVLKDSIKVILDEGIRIKSGVSKSMSVDDWAENLQKIIDAKKKGN